MSHPLPKSQADVLSDSWRSACWSTTFFFSLATYHGNGNTMIVSHHVELILILRTLNSRIVFPDFSVGSDGCYIAMSDFWSFHPNRDPSPRPKTPAIRWVLGQRNIEMEENRVQPRRKFWVDIGYMIYSLVYIYIYIKTYHVYDIWSNVYIKKYIYIKIVVIYHQQIYV